MGVMYKKALETGICFRSSPTVGTLRRDSYTRDFERGGILLSGALVHMGGGRRLWKQASLSP